MREAAAEPGVMSKKQLSSPGLKPLPLTKVVFLLGRVREAKGVFQDGGSFQVQTTPPDPPDVSPLLPRGCEGTLTSLELNFRVFWKLSTLAVAGRMLSLSFEPTATILQPDTIGKEHMKPKGDRKLRES